MAVKETSLYGPSSIRLGVESIKLHENFRTEESAGGKLKYDYNVGLLITAGDISFSLHVLPVCLPETAKFDFKDKKGMIVGWGVDKDFQVAKRLQQLEVPTYNFLECFYRNRVYFGGHVSKRNFCAGYRKDKGICSGKQRPLYLLNLKILFFAGDSGGGLFIKMKKRFFIYGLSSFSNCICVEETQTCEIFDEGIFVNVAPYVQWIHNNMF